MRLNREGQKVIIERLLDKLAVAGYTLECVKPRTIININNEEHTLLLWAVKDYEKRLENEHE